MCLRPSRPLGSWIVGEESAVTQAHREDVLGSGIEFPHGRLIERINSLEARRTVERTPCVTLRRIWISGHRDAFQL
jgi:hypothetical protein